MSTDGYVEQNRQQKHEHGQVRRTERNFRVLDIISLPPDWPGNDTVQMILGVLDDRQRVSSSPARADEI